MVQETGAAQRGSHASAQTLRYRHQRTPRSRSARLAATLPDCRARASLLEDTNLATFSADADRVLSVDHTEPYVANIEFQASHKEDGNRKVFRYAGILHYKYELPIESVVILLRPEARRPGL